MQRLVTLVSVALLAGVGCQQTVDTSPNSPESYQARSTGSVYHGRVGVINLRAIEENELFTFIATPFRIYDRRTHEFFDNQIEFELISNHFKEVSVKDFTCKVTCKNGGRERITARRIETETSDLGIVHQVCTGSEVTSIKIEGVASIKR